MWILSWLRNRTVSPKRWPARRFRPQLEMLEDRAVPATLTVNTTLDVLGHDNGMLSLRQAIIDANATPKTADTIVLPAGTYTLTRAGAGEYGCLTGDLDITASLTINGAGRATVVDAAGLDRVFQVINGAATLSGMTIQGGSSFYPGYPNNNGFGLGEGGGILNAATLTVRDSIITGNSAVQWGGGIANYGTLTVDNSVISANSAATGALYRGGGGIFNEGSLTVNNSSISANSAVAYGGGIDNYFGTLTVSNSTLSGNSAKYGGAIWNGNGTVTIQYSTLSGNSALQYGGGIFSQDSNAKVTVSYSTLSGNSAGQAGGGIYNVGKLTIRGSTVLNNSAPVGADLDNFGMVTVFDSIIGVRGP